MNTRNVELCNLAIEEIRKDPERIWMAVVSSGKFYCIAGLISKISGFDIENKSWAETMNNASNLLLCENNTFTKYGSFIPAQATVRLFFVVDWPKSFAERLYTTYRGTKEYAEVVCERIAHWRDTGE